jgi:hypothetical protein
MGEFQLDLILRKPFSPKKKLRYFDNLIKLYLLSIGTLHVVVHDTVHFTLLNVIRVDLFRIQVDSQSLRCQIEAKFEVEETPH